MTSQTQMSMRGDRPDPGFRTLEYSLERVAELLYPLNGGGEGPTHPTDEPPPTFLFEKGGVFEG